MLCLLLVFLQETIDKYENKLYYFNSKLIQKEAIGL